VFCVPPLTKTSVANRYKSARSATGYKLEADVTLRQREARGVVSQKVPTGNFVFRKDRYLASVRIQENDSNEEETHVLCRERLSAERRIA
jgi:hypothetical protein